MQDFLSHFSYAGLVLALLATGVGLPIPEDVPLLVAGYLCDEGLMRLELAIPLALASILGSDCLLYGLGRHYGDDLQGTWLTRRFATPERIARASAIYRKHGGKALFAARFLPGFRAAMFFAAGSFRVPFWKLIVFDGSAALLSVPLLVLLGWWFSDQLDVIRQEARQLQIAIAALVLLTLVAVALTLWIRRRTGRHLD